MHQFLQRLAGQGADIDRFHGHDLVVGAGFLQDVEQGFGIGRGVREYARGQRAVAGPGQFLAQGIALGASQRGRDHDQLPLSGPGVLRCEIDPAVGMFEAAPAGGGKAVIALATQLLRNQPFLLGQAIDAGAHHALVEAQRLHQLDETPQPDRPSVRGDEVAIDRDDQRVGSGRVLVEEVLDPLTDISALHIFPIRETRACQPRCGLTRGRIGPGIVGDASRFGTQYKITLM